MISKVSLLRNSADCRRGFTLIEMLVVIAIIAVLAALVTSAVSSSMQTASRAKAAANFRQLGAVITTYAADNNQQFPGPLQQNQRSGYTTSLGDGIGVKLWSQMGIPMPTRDFQPVPLLTVPALSKWKHADGHPYPSAYYVIRNVTLPGGGIIHPFGLGGQNRKAPLKVLAVPKPSSTWAIWERGGPGDPMAANRRDLSEPIHGKQRVVLLFDGSVKVVPSDQLPDPF